MIRDLRFEGLSLTVADVARSIAFYRGRLGLELTYASLPAFALLRGGPVSLALLAEDEAAKEGVSRASPDQRRGIHVEFTTDDLDTLYRDLRAEGLEFAEGPHEDPWERAMTLYDPDGYSVEFAEGRRGARLEAGRSRDPTGDHIRGKIANTSEAIGAMPLSLVASRLADAAFSSTPIINSELLQRDRPSSNAMAALRELGHAMAERADQPNLGIEGYPAERGLYLTLIEPFGLHRVRGGRWQFSDPDTDLEAGASLAPAWAVMSDAADISLAELYDFWAAPPYGLKRGVMPVLAFVFLLARRSERAIYVDGVFQPDPDAVLFDRLLQEPGAIRVRRIERSDTDLAFMTGLARGLRVPGDSSSLQIAELADRRARARGRSPRRDR